MACVVSRYKRVLIGEGRGTLRPLTDVRERPKRANKPVMMMPQIQDREDICPFELTDPSEEADGTSIEDVEMDLR